MTKDEMIAAIDNMVANPDTLLEQANALRQSLSADYDELTQTRNANDSLQSELETTKKSLQEMKDLNVQLFMQSPAIHQPNVPSTPPAPEPPTPKAEQYDSMDALIADMRSKSNLIRKGD